MQELLLIWGDIDTTERKVIVELANRLYKGHQRYGPLKKNLTSGKYKWDVELFEELLDVAVYACILRLKEELAQ